MAITAVITKWTAMEADEEYVWGGGVGTFSSQTRATFSSKPPDQVGFFENDDISMTASDGGIKNFILPRGTVVKSSAAGWIAPAGEGNDFRPIDFTVG